MSGIEIDTPEDIRAVEAAIYPKLEALKASVQKFIRNSQNMPEILREAVSGLDNYILTIRDLRMSEKSKLKIALDLITYTQPDKHIEEILIDAQVLGLTDEDLKIIKIASAFKDRENARGQIFECLSRIAEEDATIRDLDWELKHS